MKNLIIIATTLLVLASSNAVAGDGDDPRSRFHLGIKGGINQSSIVQDPNNPYNTTYDPKYGFAGGAQLSIPLGRFIGIQPEVLYSQKGFTIHGKEPDNYTFIRNTNHLDVPLMLQLKPLKAISIVGGVQYSYLLSKQDVVLSDYNLTQEEVKYDNNNITQNTFGLCGGIDVKLFHFLISGRYNVDLNHNNGDGTSTVPRYKNQVVQLAIGVVF